MLDTLILRLSQHFTPLHYTCRHFTSSHLNLTQTHFTTLSHGLTPIKFPTAPFHRTSLYFTSLHFTALLDDYSLPRNYYIYQCELNYTHSIWHSHTCEPNFHGPATESPLYHERVKAKSRQRPLNVLRCARNFSKIWSAYRQRKFSKNKEWIRIHTMCYVTSVFFYASYGIKI